MCTALVKLNWPSLLPSMREDTVIIGGRLKKELCEELKNEEWSKPYTDIDELFHDLGMDD